MGGGKARAPNLLRGYQDRPRHPLAVLVYLSPPLLTIPLRDAVWPLTFMLAHKAVPHECRHLLFTTICSAIPTSPDSGLTSRCGWTAKANPPPPNMLAHKAVPHECCHLLFTTMCSTIPTSPDSGLTSRCGWTAKAIPPTHTSSQDRRPAM